MPHNRRHIRLIRPRLQLRLVMTFTGIAALSLVMQYLLVSLSLSEIAGLLPEDGNLLLEASGHRMLAMLGVSLVALLPVTMWVGVLVTHRIAGPLYRIETYLANVLAGNAEGKCSLRRGDELQELCDLVNEVTAGRRTSRPEQRPEQQPQEEPLVSSS